MLQKQNILLIDDNEATNFYNEIIIKSMNIFNQIQSCTDGYDVLNYLLNKEKHS